MVNKKFKKFGIIVVLLACTLPAVAACTQQDQTRLYKTYNYIGAPSTNNDRPLRGTSVESLKAMVSAAADCHDALLTHQPLEEVPHSVLVKMYMYNTIQAYAAWEVMEQVSDKLDQIPAVDSSLPAWW